MKTFFQHRGFLVSTLLFLMISGIVLAQDSTQNYKVRISKPYEQLQGRMCSVNVVLENADKEFSGFNFRIGYQDSAVELRNLKPGEFFENADYDHFNYGHYGSSIDYENGPTKIIEIKADNMKLKQDYPKTDLILATMHFYITDDYNYECSYWPICFYWTECDDNILYSKSNDTVFVCEKTDGYRKRLICEGMTIRIDGDTLMPGYGGLPKKCMNVLVRDKELPIIRNIEFKNGAIHIICLCFNYRGDIDLNGYNNEIGDLRVFKDYLLGCNYDAFNDITIDGQIASTEINGDGFPLTIMDFVYLVRIISGDYSPLPIKVDSSYWGEMFYKKSRGSLSIKSKCNTPINGMHFSFLVPNTTIDTLLKSDNISDMELEYNVCHDTLKVLLYSMEKDVVIPAEKTNLFEIKYSDKYPQAVDVTAAGYNSERIAIDFK